MRARIFFILKYLLLWMLFFELCRVAFLLANYSETKAAGWGNAAGSLWHGLKMDLSMAAYISLPVCIFILLSVFFAFFLRPLIYLIYSGIILGLAIFIAVADIGLFKAWGSRIDATPLKYLSNPKEAWASVSYLPVFWIFLGMIFFWLVLFFICKRLIKVWLSKTGQAKKPFIAAGVLLLITASLIVPMRGGFQLAPINQSSVYFSKNNYSNLATVNACFNFLFSVTHNSNIKTNPFIFMSDDEANKIVSAYKDRDTGSKLLAVKGSKPNVIVIIWESFTKKATEIKRNGIDITPCFNKLKQEGIYFSDIYATGDRTDKGIVAVLSGYPAQPITSIVKIPSKASKLQMLPQYFNANGYRSLFFYGGEPEFANMKAYLSNGNFDEFTTIDNFSDKDKNSKWGAHDGVVMQKVFDDLNASRKPFFCNWLTLSSHEPFEVPVPAVITGDDDESKFLNSLHYTDSILNELVQKCKQQSWWNNTIMVIVADHGHRLPRTGKKIDDFKIPLLFLGGALAQHAVDIPATGSQIDIPVTLFCGLGYDDYDRTKFRFSKNLLDTSSPHYAYMSFNNGFGFVRPDGYFFFDNTGKQLIESGGKADSNLVKTGKAFEQVTFGDYINK